MEAPNMRAEQAMWPRMHGLANLVTQVCRSIGLMMCALADGMYQARVERIARRHVHALAIHLDQEREMLIEELCYLIECERLTRASKELLAEDGHRNGYAAQVRHACECVRDDIDATGRAS